jgi:hypothetical protein
VRYFTRKLSYKPLVVCQSFPSPWLNSTVLLKRPVVYTNSLPTVATSDPETGKTIGIVSNYAGLFLWDAAESGQAVFWSDRIRTIPGKTMEIASMIVVADKPDVIPVLSDSFKFWGRTVVEAEASREPSLTARLP